MSRYFLQVVDDTTRARLSTEAFNMLLQTPEDPEAGYESADSSILMEAELVQPENGRGKNPNPNPNPRNTSKVQPKQRGSYKKILVKGFKSKHAISKQCDQNNK